MDKINPNQYQQQLAGKIQRLNEQFADLALPGIEVLESPPLHFRMRAEFRIWHENGQAHYAMNRPGEKRPYIIDDFPIGSKSINQLMPPLLKAINASELLSRRLFSCEFLTTLSGEALITLIYHKPLDNAWKEQARALSNMLGAGIIGRSRKQKLVLNDDFVTERLQVNNQSFTYQQVENSFTQPNAKVNEKMLAWAQDCSQNLTGDLLELYCGNGNFTCVLAQNFDKVLATEISKVSVRSAQHNFAANNVNNVAIARMSSEEFTEALNGVRPFRRLKNIDLTSYNFSTVFVDPPRAGLDDGTIELIQRFDNIIYISCNPETLKANLNVLTATHQIARLAVFDQFPYSHHLECGILLKRK